MSKTTDSLTSTCVLCCQGIKIYAIGPCNHHICYKCSTKMRVICNQMYCAVCRTEMPKAIFTNKLHLFEGIISHKFPYDRKYGVFFATSRIQEEYRKILAHRCDVCGIRRQSDDTFKKLQDHMRKDHELFSCQLCVDNIKVLSSERRFYTRKELAQHRRSGDPDDTSYRGHPLCEFCDERYFDNDELLRHLRKDHYFCHFCEKDGVTNQYYGEYEDLGDHFRTDHYLCEEDGCHNEKFLGAFRTDIDLKAHRAKVHSGKMTKSQARQTRQVDVEINLPARPREYNRGRRDGAYGGGGRGGGRGRYPRELNNDTAMAIEASLETAKQEDVGRVKERQKKMTVKPQPKEAKNDRKGPELGRGRPISPIEALHPKTETRAKKKVDEDKENEVLKPDVVAATPAASNAVSNKDSYASNIEKKPPDMDMSDFPTLAEPGNPFQMGGRWSSAPRQTEVDFPVLGNGDGGADIMPLTTTASFGFYSSLHTNKPLSTTIPAEPSHQRADVANDDADFPTLSSIASLLGGKPKKVNGKKKKNKQSAVVDSKPNAAADSRAPNFSSVVESRKESGAGKSRDVKVDRAVEKPSKPPKTQHTMTSTLSTSSTAPSAPSDSRPPPGFAAFPSLSSSSSSNNRRPPPGFGSLQNASTNSGPEFVQPPNFKQRNRDLVAKIQDFCLGSDELFGKFKQNSGEFRQNIITAAEYYHQCILTLSEDNFHSIFNELVTLLPDLAKQQDLLTAHNNYKASKTQSRQDTVLKISNTKPTKSGKKTAWKATSSSKGESSLCPVCSQVVMTRDLAEHMNVHDDYPALSTSRAAPKPGPTAAWSSSTWGRGK